jgi:hypothetical protein
MQCEHVRERWPDYVSGSIGPSERAAIDLHLGDCAACRDEAGDLGRIWQLLGAIPEEAPSPALRERVDAMVDAWRDGARAGARLDVHPGRARDHWWRRFTWSPAWQLAFASLCLFVGFSSGRLWTPAPPTAEMAELRGEVQSMKTMVALSLLQQQSATERLRGVTWSHELERPGSEVLDALLDTLRHDPNVNVRLAAVDALQQFAVGRHTGGVREGLIDSVAKQDSPLVQIALVDALVTLKESRSADMLRRLAASATTNESVKKRASWALTQIG